MTIKTYTPLRGMLYCEDGTGDYVRKVDHLDRVEKLEAVADAARGTLPKNVRYGLLSNGQIELHRALAALDAMDEDNA